VGYGKNEPTNWGAGLPRVTTCGGGRIRRQASGDVWPRGPWRVGIGAAYKLRFSSRVCWRPKIEDEAHRQEE